MVFILRAEAIYEDSSGRAKKPAPATLSRFFAYISTSMRPFGGLSARSFSRISYRVPLSRSRPLIRHSHHATTSKLNSPTVEDVNYFASFLPQTSIIASLGNFKAEKDDLDQYNTDWMGKYRGNSQVILRPKSTAEVSRILKHCWERRIGVVPQGGNTGLVGAVISRTALDHVADRHLGGSIPVHDEVVLSLAGMNNVRSFDPVSGK
jgi:hypothetical protein